MWRSLPLIGGGETIVDEEDFQEQQKYPWSRSRDSYVYRLGPGPPWQRWRHYLHRQILRPGPGQDVHHKNRNPLDNRRANLECLSKEEHGRCHQRKFPAVHRRRGAQPVDQPRSLFRDLPGTDAWGLIAVEMLKEEDPALYKAFKEAKKKCRSSSEEGE